MAHGRGRRLGLLRGGTRQSPSVGRGRGQDLRRHRRATGTTRTPWLIGCPWSSWSSRSWLDGARSRGATWSYRTHRGQRAAGSDGSARTSWAGCHHHGSVASSGNLPTSGNKAGDAYITQDTGHLWVWDGTAWVDAGPFVGIGGQQAWPAYKVVTLGISVNAATGGTSDVVLLDGTVLPDYDGWVEILVNGGYGGNSTFNVNCRQGLYAPDYLDPTGQAWLAWGWMASPGPAVWEVIGDCQLSFPVTKGTGPHVSWRGNWSPTTLACSFRSRATVKFFSAVGQPIAIGPVGPAGPAGPQGPPGPGGVDPSQLGLRFVQPTAATTWSISHTLPFYPNVAVVDSTKREIIPGAIDFPSNTAVTLTFSAAVAGEAYLS